MIPIDVHDQSPTTMISTTAAIANNQEHDDMDIEEEEMINIEVLESLGINAGDVKKLKDAGFHSFQQIRTTTKKQLIAIKGFSDAKYNKLVEAVQKKVQWNCFTTASDVVSCGVLV